MPYAGILLKLMYKRCCCCCKRKSFKPERNKNPEFNMERRYAAILNTIFMVFTFSYSMPGLPMVAVFVLSIQYVLDKLLITYYFKERIEHNDFLNRTFLMITQFSIVVFYIFSAYTCMANYCTIANIPDTKITYSTEFATCF